MRSVKTVISKGAQIHHGGLSKGHLSQHQANSRGCAKAMAVEAGSKNQPGHLIDRA